MSYFVRVVALLLVFVLVVLDGSPALSAKDNGAKESSLQKANNVRKAKIRRIHNPKKSQLQKFNKQHLKLDRSEKKMGRLLDGRSQNKMIIRHKKKLGINAYQRKPVAFHKKKKANRILKPKRMKKKTTLFENQNLKTKRRTYKNKRVMQRQLKNKASSLKSQKPRVASKFKSRVASNNLENDVIKKHMDKIVHEGDIKASTSSSELINNDVIKNAPGDKKEVKDSKAILGTTTELYEIIDTRYRIRPLSRQEYKDLLKKHNITTVTAENRDKVGRILDELSFRDPHPWDYKYEEWYKKYRNDPTAEPFQNIVNRAERERIKKYGGDPDEYEEICTFMMDWDCYQKSKFICKKKDWTGRCINGYNTISRHDDSGKLIHRTIRYMDPPRKVKYMHLQDFGAKQTCIWSERRCVYFEKLLQTNPDLAREINHRFMGKLDQLDNEFKDISQNFKTGMHSKGNDYEVALYVLDNIMKQSDDASCGDLITILPFLTDVFFKSAEHCNLW